MSFTTNALLLVCMSMASPQLYAANNAVRKSMNFHQEEVSYRNNAADVTLTGTLTLPQATTPVAAVVLIAGYGPSDRDATRANSYFKVLAEYLTEQGIAVLRYDKRGAGQSTGSYATATSRDFANDAFAGIAYLKTRTEVNVRKIGLVGISEGGLIAAMLAAESSDVAFTVLMAPAVDSSVESFVEQSSLQLRADGASIGFIERDKQIRRHIHTIVTQEADAVKAEEMLRAALTDYLASIPESDKVEATTLPFAFTEAKASMLVAVFNAQWYRFYWNYDAASALQRITTPLLCVNGTTDWIMSPRRAFARLEQSLPKAGNSTLVELPNLNHCFQTCTTGALAEYATLKEAIAPVALKTIGDWIKVIINK